MTETAGPVPIKVRLEAWWKGYDPDAYWQTILAGEPPPEPKPNGEAKPAKPTAAKPRRKPEKAGPPAKTWDEKRMEIAQFVWGDGYCGPGGPEHIITMSKLLALSPEMSVLALGAELGGPARTLSKEYGAWISGYERSRDLVEAGNKLSADAGLSKKAKLHHYDFENPKAFDRQFDRVFSKEALFTVKDKKGLFSAIEPYIKGDGLMLLTDYVVASEKDIESTEIKEWVEGEPVTPHLSTAEQLVNAVKDAQLAIRVNEDVSSQYIQLIANSWHEADKLVAQLMARGDEGQDMVGSLLSEAELWSRRSKLLESGKLKLWRVVAHKKVLTSLMSDW